MLPDTAIFDMDGLLVDSEPLWHEAAVEAMQAYGVRIDAEAYAGTVGLRTKEFLHHWFEVYGIDMAHAVDTETDITSRVTDKLRLRGRLMPGAEAAVRLLRQEGMRIGLATSSPLSLVEAFFELSGMAHLFDAVASAEHLEFGKPHPQVYIDCIRQLGRKAASGVCFEDSFNGMLAAKSARMRCIVVPAPESWDRGCWGAADLKLASLEQLTIALVRSL
jgi:HAD superfamily hydrolase (TIGR01509 family)